MGTWKGNGNEHYTNVHCTYDARWKQRFLYSTALVLYSVPQCKFEPVLTTYGKYILSLSYELNSNPSRYISRIGTRYIYSILWSQKTKLGTLILFPNDEKVRSMKYIVEVIYLCLFYSKSGPPLNATSMILDFYICKSNLVKFVIYFTYTDVSCKRNVNTLDWGLYP